jgi:hypothetical protein
MHSAAGKSPEQNNAGPGNAPEPALLAVQASHKDELTKNNRRQIIHSGGSSTAAD